MSDPSAIAAPLCLGQENRLDSNSLAAHALANYREVRQFINFGDVWVLPDGTTYSATERAIRTLVDRHESLRTFYRNLGDPDGAAQIIVRAPEFEIQHYTADHDEWPSNLAAPMPTHLRSIRSDAFNLTEELSWRSAIVTVGGSPRCVIFGSDPIMADLQAYAILRSEFYQLLSGIGPALPTPYQPRELAYWQRSSSGQSMTKRSLNYWRDFLENAPAAIRFKPNTDGISSYRLKGGAALYLKTPTKPLAEFASRLDVTLGSFILTFWCIKISQLLNKTHISISTAATNRFSPKLRTIVSYINREAPLYFTIPAGAAFTDVVRHVHQTCFNAYRSLSPYDPTAIKSLQDEYEAIRGETIGGNFGFNNRVNAGNTIRDKSQGYTRYNDEVVQKKPIEIPESLLARAKQELEQRPPRYFFPTKIGDYVQIALNGPFGAIPEIDDPCAILSSIRNNIYAVRERPDIRITDLE